VHACVTAHPHLAAAAAAGFLALGYASLINDSGLVILGVGVALLAPTFALGLMRAGASSAEYLEDINGQKPGAAAPSNA
ncbi:hypothetical protein R6G99_08035, partial [Actinotignum timonense]|nr:hypothetical protein [Actinotignum timonense]